MTEITATDSTKHRRTYRVGDRVKVDTKSNIGVVEDVIRTCFVQVQQIAGSPVGPAVILERHAWAFVRDIRRAS